MLDDDQITKLKAVLASPGWIEVMHPAITTHSNLMIKQLILSTAERMAEFKEVSDEDLKGRIRAVAWLLDTLSNTILVHEHNRRRDELDRQNHHGEPVREEVR